MEDQKLDREAIALSILNGIVGALQAKQDEGGFGGHGMSLEAQQEACRMAFQMADQFILARDKEVPPQ